MSEIDVEVARIIGSGALGRSPVYKRLLGYLCEKTNAGILPKEIDIATDVFDRRGFDPANDSTVRVYLHKLRHKLDSFYASESVPSSRRLVVPKGEYQIRFVDGESAPPNTSGHTLWKRPAIAVLVLISIASAFLIGRSTTESSSVTDKFRQSVIWQPFFADDQPVTVVVGDYFIFAEQNEYGEGSRLIRDFDINSRKEFAEYISNDPLAATRYRDVRLSYLPTGIGAALDDVLGVLHQRGGDLEVVPQSQFTAQMMRSRHVVYVGYFSGMGSLADYAFKSSRLSLGPTYDELIDSDTGESFFSFAGYIGDHGSSYTDFALVSSFPGPSGNHFLYVAGMRDEGLMRMASIVADSEETNAVSVELGVSGQGAKAFEVLYEVSGIDRTDVAAKRLFVSPLDADSIW